MTGSAGGVSRNRAVLDRFYLAINRMEVDELAASIEDGFAPDAVMRISDSLPYGGSHRGRDAIKGMLTKLVTTRTPMVLPDKIVVKRMLEQGDQIAVEPDFLWLAPGASEPIRMSAVEWFVFSDGRVTEMQVGYWDTAACVRAMDAARSG